jgi:hypothetical protein
MYLTFRSLICSIFTTFGLRVRMRPTVSSYGCKQEHEERAASHTGARCVYLKRSDILD